MDHLKRLRKTGGFVNVLKSTWFRIQSMRKRQDQTDFSKGTERNRNCGAMGERETKIGSLLDLGEH
uniref:Uncharacterized protein n=1 Tax=Anopheles atroparvus TaxID=41427 RepID=A0AAG5CND3_ANOAO